MKLIDADALIVAIANVAKKCAKSDAQKSLMGRVIYILEHRKEDVVRCKDCKHYGYDGLCKLHSEDADQFTTGYALAMDDDDFCSYGERNEA